MNSPDSTELEKQKKNKMGFMDRCISFISGEKKDPAKEAENTFAKLFRVSSRSLTMMFSCPIR